LSKKGIASLFVTILLLTGCSSSDEGGSTNYNSPDTVITEIQAEPIDFDITDLDFSNLRTEVHSLDQVFILEDALFRASQISDALESFRVLTEKSKGKISSEELEKLGNTDWLSQYLGFLNWTSAVNGTLIKQDFEIKKLELELAIKQFEDGEIDQESLDLKEAAFRLSMEQFQLYLDSYRIVD